MLPLFTVFKKLGEVLPYCQLGTLPTPVSPMSSLTTKLGGPDLYIKRDDLSGSLYGGNKIRKLEFILADALRKNCKRVITSGAAGSNHALATALYSARCGLQPTLMLFEQPLSPAIGPTLLADYAAGAEMHHDTTYTQHVRHLRDITEHHRLQDGEAPYLIPAGGSSVTGTAGFVNAAFELRQQLTSSGLPIPETIFTALGTMGTAAGLLLGLKTAGISSHLVAVQVVPDVVANFGGFKTLYDETNTFLHRLDPSFPLAPLSSDDVSIVTDFLGDGYGFPTAEGTEAIALFKKYESISLDPVYTGKTAAALIHHCLLKTKNNSPGPVLFWNTKSSIFPETGHVGYHLLPSEFHHYFV
jgi:1-aminocyclopropane-1-carboxylate deaminase/D-cysteine desulfhydrase-like pyridoxal-dependent ACC family enzyme